MPLKEYDFTIRVIGPNPHREATDNWRAGRIVEAMEGCYVPNIVTALKAFEENCTKGVGDPARWLTHFAGLESDNTGKRIKPWIQILNCGQVLQSTAAYRDLLRDNV